MKTFPASCLFLSLKNLLSLGLLVVSLLSVSRAAETPAPPALTGPATATKEKPWVNSLGMRFVPVARTEVLLIVWDTRVQDYGAYASATRRKVFQPSFEQGPTHPVVRESLIGAQAFATWLTDKERREGTLTAGQSYRLPQDWEWSVAVGLNERRAGTPHSKNLGGPRDYPWGTQWRPPRGAGNYAQVMGVDDYKYTSPVGSFAANRFGPYDMGGNGWQWCEDSFDGRNEYRVLRGGSWDYGNSFLSLSSCRLGIAPDHRSNGTGFRLVLDGSGGAR